MSKTAEGILEKRMMNGGVSDHPLAEVVSLPISAEERLAVIANRPRAEDEIAYDTARRDYATRQIARRASENIARQMKRDAAIDSEREKQRHERREARRVRREAREKLGRFAFVDSIMQKVVEVSDKAAAKNYPPGLSKSDAIARAITKYHVKDRWFWQGDELGGKMASKY